MKRTVEVKYHFECPHPGSREHFESAFQRPFLEVALKLRPNDPMEFVAAMARSVILKWGGTPNTAMLFPLPDNSEVNFCGSVCSMEEYMEEQTRLW